MARILFISLVLIPQLAIAYEYDEHMPIAPRPTVEPKEINVPNNPDIPTNDIKPYEQTYDL